ncbi:IPT/TIG domain-containing protein [Adhaeribacter arboris]|uniref:IPT/TIG domain-containing protein n=1 Tax=Adhaeribacter arboris TaxID=2072846 RepID=UPI001304BBFF|nr:IPT/TIG domain-containing protein [Adhaeribacter arboris]
MAKFANGQTTTITSITPAAGAAVNGTATINGTNLGNTTGVAFNGVPATNFTVVNNTRITATVPPGATSGAITVTTSLGSVVSSQIFKVIPGITSLSPTAGPIGTLVTITGTSFTGASSVRFNGTEAVSFTVNSDNQITATVPVGTTVGRIAVTTPSGTGTSSTSVTFTPPPTIASITGPGGISSAIIGNTITINGTNFTSTATVTFTNKSGTPVTTTKTYVSSAQLTAIVPVGAVTGVVTVTNAAGSASASFTITNTTYTWNNTLTSWANPNSWTPARTAPSSNDLLIFEGAITNNPILDFASTSETIGYLSISSPTITFTVASDKSLIIDNDVAAGTTPDFVVSNGANLIVTNSANGADLIINITAGETGAITGTITFQSGASNFIAEHQLLATAGSLNFTGSGKFVAASTLSGSPFGTTSLGSVVFATGTTYSNQSGASPFGAASPDAVVIFNSNSTYSHEVNSAPDLIGRTFGNLIISNAPNASTAFNQTVAGSGNLVVKNNFTFNTPVATLIPTFNLNLDGNITISGILNVSRGTLNFNPATTSTVTLSNSISFAFNGILNFNNVSGVTNVKLNGVNRTISGTAGTFSLGANTILSIETGASITLSRNITGNGKIIVNGTVRTTNTNGLLGGTATSFANSLQSVTLNQGSTVEYTGTGAQTISSANYDNLTIAGNRPASAVIALPNTLKVAGTFTLAPAGSIPVYNTTNSTIEFNGGVQIIPNFNYNNVIISGTDDKVLGSDIIINGDLKMIANKVDATDFNLILGNNATIIGEAPGRYVVGKLSATRTINNTSSNFGGIGFIIGNGANTGNTTVSRIAGPNSSVLVEDKEGINRRWEVIPGNQPTSPVSVTLSWVADDDNGKDLTTARVWKTQGEDGTTFYDVSQVDQDASGRSISVTVSSFSTFTVSDRNNPLPVELTYFNVVKKGQNAVLTWQTATEKNNYGFGVEISSDAIHFEEVGFVKSLNPNATTLQNYEFTHRPAGTGTVYYRLKQTDWSGTSKYYGPKALRFDQASSTLLAYPNPVTDKEAEVTILADGMTKEKVTITVTDALGRVVSNQIMGPKLTQGEIKVNVSRLPVGVYFINATTPTQAAQTKIIKH